MPSRFTTIRVSPDQRGRLRQLAEARNASLADTLDAALESLRRQLFFEAMASAEAALRGDPFARDSYVRDRDAWLNADQSST